MVSAATATAVSASISTPVCALVRTRASMSYPRGRGISSTSTPDSGSGWHSGMSAAVCLAAMMPASRAACSGSPFLMAPRRINRRASADIEMLPRATASRLVTALAPTSTIFTRPRASTCDRLVFFAIALRQEERQALERHGEIDALQLHARRDFQCPRREVEDCFDAGGHHQVEHLLRRRGRYRDDGDANAFTARRFLEVVDVADRHPAA